MMHNTTDAKPQKKLLYEVSIIRPLVITLLVFLHSFTKIANGGGKINDYQLVSVYQWMCCLIIVISYLFSLIKWHPTYQLLAVVASSALIVWGTYFVLRIIRDNHPDLFISMKTRLKLRMRNPVKFYHWVQELCDGHTRRRRRNLKLKR